MDFIDLLWWLIVGHFLCDYPLQNDYLAVHKNPIINGKKNSEWFICLFAHSSIHTLPVMWLTGRVELAMVMLVTHMIIDYVRCKQWIHFWQDQFLHIVVVIGIAMYACA